MLSVTMMYPPEAAGVTVTLWSPSSRVSSIMATLNETDAMFARIVTDVGTVASVVSELPSMTVKGLPNAGSAADVLLRVTVALS